MKQLNCIRIIGDVHGHHGRYVSLIKKPKYSVQLGDLNFDYTKMQFINSNCHKFIPGNHDNYESLPPHALPGDWGFYKFEDFDWEFLYIRGAFSIDRDDRIVGISWWPQEEISWTSGKELIKIIQKKPPKIILSHDCPNVCHHYGVTPGAIRTLTSDILDTVWDECQPELWIFGHHHHSWEKYFDRTRFICLNELDFIDILPSGQINRSENMN